MIESEKSRFFPFKKFQYLSSSKSSTKINKMTQKNNKDDKTNSIKKFADLNHEDYYALSASPRRRAREAALMLFFQIDMSGTKWELATNILQDIGLKDANALFAKKMVSNAIEDREKSDKIINLYAKEWTIDRFAAIDRSILRLAISELLRNSKNNQNNIIINEAIELAKKFGDASSSSFINGILDTILINEIENEIKDLPL